MMVGRYFFKRENKKFAASKMVYQLNQEFDGVQRNTFHSQYLVVLIRPLNPGKSFKYMLHIDDIIYEFGIFGP